MSISLSEAVSRLQEEAKANAELATSFHQKNEALRAENAKLRHENNRQDGVADAEIESLRFVIQDMRREYGALREEYANRGAIIQDFAKREHETQKLVAELEKQIGHMEQIIREFFPASVIPAPLERDGMTIPQGEWVLRSNEALRRRAADLERQCKVGELTAQNWKSGFEHQMAVNARQRSRIAELRLQLKLITIERLGGTATMAQMAQMALDADDCSLDCPITQEAK